ncbi:MAG: beta-ribofuranosylaminobenzene 5'-phosphate synthase [Candidatus Helarchaeota archaeon]
MKVKIITPCRLHFSLIDLNGSIGRIDGGLGVALNEPNVIVEAEMEDNNKNTLEIINFPGYLTEEIEDLLKHIIKSLKIDQNFSLRVTSNIQAHVGLGSKTQLSLSLSKALCLLNNIESTPHELARLTARAGTSRIGLTAFERGGFIMDGGHTFGKGKEKETYLPSSASNAPPAPILYWSEVPSDWYFIITIPQIKRGAHGSEEIDIFQRNCPIPLDEVKTVCHIILMKILPSMSTKNIDSFGQGIYELQHLGFKKIEIELQDQIISELIDFYMENGASGSGMSSFGPTTFALIKGLSNAQHLKQEIEEFLKNRYKTQIIITNVNNQGVKTEIV